MNLNTSKSVVLRVGSLKNTTLTYCDELRFQWTSDNAKTLGTVFSNNNEDVFKLNFLPKLQSFKNCLKQWEHRKLTLMGKVTVIKTFALPKLILPLSVLPNPPNKIIQEIKKDIFNFIWDKKNRQNQKRYLNSTHNKRRIKSSRRREPHSFIKSLLGKTLYRRNKRKSLEIIL